jgi:hypothetical protein
MRSITTFEERLENCLGGGYVLAGFDAERDQQRKEEQNKREGEKREKRERKLTPFPTNTSAFSAVAISTAMATYACSPSSCTSRLLFKSSHPSCCSARLSASSHHPQPLLRTSRGAARGARRAGCAVWILFAGLWGGSVGGSRIRGLWWGLLRGRGGRGGEGSLGPFSPASLGSSGSPSPSAPSSGVGREEPEPRGGRRREGRRKRRSIQRRIKRIRQLRELVEPHERRAPHCESGAVAFVVAPPQVDCYEACEGGL